jgi:hypothetical protein
VAFLIEAAKSNESLELDETNLNAVSVSYANGQIQYVLTGNTDQFTEIVLYDIMGKKIMTLDILGQHGAFSVSTLQTGLYFTFFITEGWGAVSKKVLNKH